MSRIESKRLTTFRNSLLEQENLWKHGVGPKAIPTIDADCKEDECSPAVGLERLASPTATSSEEQTSLAELRLPSPVPAAFPGSIVASSSAEVSVSEENRASPPIPFSVPAGHFVYTTLMPNYIPVMNWHYPTLLPQLQSPLQSYVWYPSGPVLDFSHGTPTQVAAPWVLPWY